MGADGCIDLWRCCKELCRWAEQKEMIRRFKERDGNPRASDQDLYLSPNVQYGNQSQSERQQQRDSGFGHSSDPSSPKVSFEKFIQTAKIRSPDLYLPSSPIRQKPGSFSFTKKALYRSNQDFSSRTKVNEQKQKLINRFEPPKTDQTAPDARRLQHPSSKNTSHGIFSSSSFGSTKPE
jgi:hypothetical protein